MNHNFDSLLTYIHKCFVPKLNEPYDSRPDYCFDFHNKTICERLNKLFNVITEIDAIAADNTEYKLDLVSSLLILLEELQVKGSWCTDNARQGAERLKEIVSQLLGHDIYDLLKNEEDNNFNVILFEECLKKLHIKLNSKDWKFYPSFMQVYIRVVYWIEVYGIKPNLPLTCPALLLLLDDFSTDNKISGLQCLYVIIGSFNSKEYQSSGYELVIVDVLLKHIHFKEVSILEKALQCVILLPLILSSDETSLSQWSANDDVLEIILYDVYVECDIQRKAVYFQYLPKLISLHKYGCIRWKKKLVEILCHELSLCVSSQRNDLLLINCLSTLEACFSHFWPVFSYKMDNCILQILIKVLYNQCLEKSLSDAVMEKNIKIIRCFLALCSKSERDNIFKDYAAISSKIKSNTFNECWAKITEE